MTRTLDEVVDSLSQERQARVSARHQELRREVEGLRALRKVVGKAQSEMATLLRIKQPSVSKLERQADMYLSTLRTFVEALGGKLELVVHLPDRPPLRLNTISEMTDVGLPDSVVSLSTQRKPAISG